MSKFIELAAMHKAATAQRLKNYGLRFEDCFDPKEDLDIKEALNRLPREIVDARNQRLKRAIDLSMKHEYLSPEMQARQTPFRSYLSDMLALVSLPNEVVYERENTAAPWPNQLNSPLEVAGPEIANIIQLEDPFRGRYC